MLAHALRPDEGGERFECCVSLVSETTLSRNDSPRGLRKAVTAFAGVASLA